MPKIETVINPKGGYKCPMCWKTKRGIMKPSRTQAGNFLVCSKCGNLAAKPQSKPEPKEE